MKRSDFHYDLPSDLIAQTPRERGRSRMMVVTPRDGEPAIEHRSFSSFPDLLGAGDVLVLNDTRVFPARLFAEPKPGMQRPIEILLVHDAGPMSWEAWCRPAKRVRRGDVLRFSETLSAEVMGKSDEGVVALRFAIAGTSDAMEAERRMREEVDRIGVTPLPPYIARQTPDPTDRDAYQTVYAAERGAIAAPTAGLHFTTAVLDEIAARGVEIVRITLHVGIGTFKPVKVDDIREHRMDAERYDISDAAAERLNLALTERRRIVAAGTTTVRTLESAIRAGDGRFSSGHNETSIFITPGFEFRAVDALLTNFHLPESTLLMLVSAFAGIETIRQAYRVAIRERYLFYSYGDCMFLRSSVRNPS
ncbi:MAG TPA: tRNA preQ1(34) S-adenosylmethionine ribosyltransferase-isomerase QueA [Thermoanaerobaculia bacterium]|nr:tRNA preQ1(34) S-adenosylmethionine ribosyltransferase-isomerase QueA [Thermoanaerobaculia bacterium]